MAKYCEEQLNAQIHVLITVQFNGFSSPLFQNDLSAMEAHIQCAIRSCS